ncbi:uncharacterized protein LOC108666633 [Hyalella azteca]|uniref:Uncharacterized protein LOC108666633 n=1 Tax=Hyalella azteca TaxID=294128 RepID=A0A8B7N6X3_HYAAZ|nr:uncharacterized protein LOC108666633 [Hyalella azteca]
MDAKKLLLMFYVISSVTGTNIDENFVTLSKPPSKLSCMAQAVRAQLYSLKTKLGVAYFRGAVSETMYGRLGVWADLGVGGDVVSCAERAARGKLATFLLRQGQCLAMNASIPVKEACLTAGDVILYTSDPNVRLPDSVLSNLVVSLARGESLYQVKLNVTFSDASPYTEFYSYLLKFDGKTEVVTSGAQLVTEMTGCLGLNFTLTAYFGATPRGPSVSYQLPDSAVLQVAVNTTALVSTNNFSSLTLAFSNVIQSDPCRLALGYRIVLSQSSRGDANRTFDFPVTQSQVNLDCNTTNDYQNLAFSVVTNGVAPQQVNLNPGSIEKGQNAKEKYFDKNIGKCVAIQNVQYPFSVTTSCVGVGSPLTHALIVRGFERRPSLSALAPLNYNGSVWKWDDGTILPATDAMWASDPTSTANFATCAIYYLGTRLVEATICTISQINILCVP